MPTERMEEVEVVAEVVTTWPACMHCGFVAPNPIFHQPVPKGSVTEALLKVGAAGEAYTTDYSPVQWEAFLSAVAALRTARGA